MSLRAVRAGAPARAASVALPFADVEGRLWSGGAKAERGWVGTVANGVTIDWGERASLPSREQLVWPAAGAAVIGGGAAVYFLDLENATIRLRVPLPAITESLFARFNSRQEDSPAMKAVAALRNQFGGHAVKSE